MLCEPVKKELHLLILTNSSVKSENFILRKANKTSCRMLDYVGDRKCWREAYFLKEWCAGLENVGVFFFLYVTFFSLWNGVLEALCSCHIMGFPVTRLSDAIKLLLPQRSSGRPSQHQTVSFWMLPHLSLALCCSLRGTVLSECPGSAGEPFLYRNQSNVGGGQGGFNLRALSKHTSGDEAWAWMKTAQSKLFCEEMNPSDLSWGEKKKKRKKKKKSRVEKETERRY